MLLLRNADLYTPAPQGERDLLVAGGLIAAIGPYLSAGPADWPIEEIDLEGKLLLPGLIDAHLHLTGGGGEGGPETRVPPLSLTDLSRAGVTTGVGLLGTDTSTRSIAELLAVARGLERLGLSTFCYTGGYPVPPLTLTGGVRSDIVHVDRIIAVGELAISDHRSTQPTHDELARIAADAHIAGMMTGKAGLVHFHLGDGPRGLAPLRRLLDETELPARVLHPTHVNRNRRLWAEAKALSSRGITLDITAFDPDDVGLSGVEALVDYLESGLDPARVTLSSDGGGCLPEFDADGVLLRMGVGTSMSLLATLRGAVARGIELELALAATTRNVARLYRMHDRGEIAVGKRADLLVVNHDLEVDLVIANGRILVRDCEPLVHGPFEARP
jgi:beta-aspartyl-dipeptidase (metallo-type)